MFAKPGILPRFASKRSRPSRATFADSRAQHTSRRHIRVPSGGQHVMVANDFLR